MHGYTAGQQLEPSFPNAFILWETCLIFLHAGCPFSCIYSSDVSSPPRWYHWSLLYRFAKIVINMILGIFLHIKFNINIKTILEQNVFFFKEACKNLPCLVCNLGLSPSLRCDNRLLFLFRPERTASVTSMKVLNSLCVQLLGLPLPLNAFPIFLLHLLC